ncbi:hypothetical protein FEM48_Zijuj06G0173100 [Ziziphus jujuba var. spinosa]|uniref:No apical meristem-associated C-terminal domain-containing protein n=1 Tax=Ziziphus jujuba var. spinosa TaxID=714518 RepID=A0A978VAL1_ZIZJJ|nr:hypothetical protein FEM48_Zijuj06G0173100 [Ziziphus jujuba var. spinosa]
MNASYFSHVSQQFGSGFTYQGLLNAPTIPFDTRNGNATKESKHKSKATQKYNSQSSVSNKNLTQAEDVALTKAWLYISVDSDIGNSQKNTAMWDRILLTWKDNMEVEYSNVQNTNSLQCRWVKIQGAVNKFHGLYERLERNPQSGTTPEDMKREAMRMYENLNDGKSFNYDHCWKIMIKNPKWCSKGLTKTNESRKQKSYNGIDNPPLLRATQGSISNEEDGYVMDTSAAEGTNYDGVVRPQGRKGCKEKKRRFNEEKGVVDALNKLQCTLEKQIDVHQEELELKREKDKKELELREQMMKKEIKIKEKAQKIKEKAQKIKIKDQELKKKAQKREQQNLIINQDLNKLSLALQKTYEMYQAQILKEWKNDGLFAK